MLSGCLEECCVGFFLFCSKLIALVLLVGQTAKQPKGQTEKRQRGNTVSELLQSAKINLQLMAHKTPCNVFVKVDLLFFVCLITKQVAHVLPWFA